MEIQTEHIVIIITILLGLIVGYIFASGVKTQMIRLIDVIFIGPLMIFIGTQFLGCGNNGYPTQAAMALILAGAATMTYNGRNYYITNKTETTTLQRI